ncbi:hypothetical protein BDN72DRAFT_583629 [Pluteus cervinus]|uniref:Uncharacterized protein n=1 Tax=Pluteus cervinus TaxID=181527 RepID=A0ACD3AW68_9AGAR|nr:hypothetical protein BDN72DRAFT_583629 [Pluteus cervinus]
MDSKLLVSHHDAPRTHRCLYVAELLSNIVDFAFADQDNGGLALASLASTSKSFHVPAVDVLWRALPNIVPLLKCLPSDLWRGSHDMTYTLTRYPRADDWTRFNYYAPHVRRLGYSHSFKPLAGDIWCGVALITRLAIPACGLHLPNLCCICWHTEARKLEEAFFLSSLILPRGMVELDFGVQESWSLLALLPTLNNLPTLSTSLRTLRLSAHSPVSFTMPDGFIRGFDLHEFSCTVGKVSSETLQGLIALPNLHTLHLADCTEDAFDCPSTMKPFPSLRHIGLSRVILSVANSLLSRLAHVPLESIELRFKSSVVYDSFCPKLVGVFQFRALKSLKLQHSGSSPFDTLQPFYQLSQLQCLQLQVPLAIHTKSSAWAAAWPLLRDLQLGGRGIKPESIAFTPQDLIRIAEAWPHLESLRVTLKISGGISKGLFHGIREHPSLTTLHIYSSPMGDDPHTFATFVSMLFPRLTSFRFETDQHHFQEDSNPEFHFSLISKLRRHDREHCHSK